MPKVKIHLIIKRVLYAYGNIRFQIDIDNLYIICYNTQIMRRGYMPERLSTPVAILGIALAFSGGASWVAGEITKATYGSDDAKEYVEDNGYTNVELEDTDTVFVGVRGCAQQDTLSYEFHADSPAGNEVDVLVCKGLLKGATLRQG